MAEQQPISAAIRPPLITEKPPVPWWKQRSKRQPRKVLVNRPRKRGKRGKAAGKNPQQAESQPQSTEGATQETSGNTSTNVPTAKNVNTFKRRKRKKHNKLLVLDSWINDGGAGSDQPLEGTSADDNEEEEEVVVLDSWENENVVVDLTQQSSTEPASDNNCTCGRSHGGHVTNGSSAAAVVAETERQLDVTNNTVTAYGPPDQGLSANELKVLFRRKRGRGRGKRKLLTAPSNNLTAHNLPETVVKIDPEIKVKSPLLPTPLPLLGGPPMQSSAAPRTSTADIHGLKNLPPFSGLTSLFDSSLSDPVHVPPSETDYSSQGQPMNTLSNSYPSHSQSLTSGRPPPLLDSGELTNRGNPFKDTITPPMPLRRVTPEKIGSRQDPLQQLQVPGYNASSARTSSLNPNLTVLSPATANNRPFTRPPSKPLLPTPVSARSPPPTLRGGGGGPASRQLKITSFLSPPKKRPDDLVRLEPKFGTSLAIPSVSHVGSSTRPPSLFPPERTAEYGGGATFLPPIAYPVSKLRDGSGVLPLSDQDSIFDRLDSSTKYHQSRLQFGTNPSQHTLELAPPLPPPLHDIHDDPFSRLGPSVTSLNALSMSQFGDSFATGGNTRIPSSSSETNRRRPHPHTDRPRLPADSMISQQGTDVVVKLEPGVVKYEDDPSFSPRLYQTRPGGLNVRKALNRFAPKHYQITGAAQPSTSFALVKQERDISVIDTDTRDVPGSSSGERFVDIQQDSVRNVQQISGHSPHDLERTVTEAGVSITDNSTGQDDADGEFQDTDDDELDYVESNNIHIPLSRTGLKIVAIDCEMVGCRRRIPHEQLLASRMKGGIGVAQGNRGGGRGGLGVLLKTKMKPQVLSKTQKRKMNKEISVAARCSIIAYDGTVIYDKYINPTIGTDYTIVNYRTPWSGIRPSHMTCATPFLEARREILDILQRCIVIGHNIRSDLRSLEISGLPEWQIRDTSCHPTLKRSAGGSRALKQMAHVLLDRDIQTKSRVGHCSVEDATATMDLYKLVELEWE